MRLLLEIHYLARVARFIQIPRRSPNEEYFLLGITIQFDPFDQFFGSERISVRENFIGELVSRSAHFATFVKIIKCITSTHKITKLSKEKLSAVPRIVDNEHIPRLVSLMTVIPYHLTRRVLKFVSSLSGQKCVNN